MLVQVVEAEHAADDTSKVPLKPLEAMLSVDLSHPNIIHTYKYYSRIRQVCTADISPHQQRPALALALSLLCFCPCPVPGPCPVSAPGTALSRPPALSLPLALPCFCHCLCPTLPCLVFTIMCVTVHSCISRGGVDDHAVCMLSGWG